MKTTKPILDPNLGVFVQLVVDAALQGWTIQEQNPPQLLGYMYETVMERDEDVIDPPPKPTRAEILAKARAAKAEKAAPQEELKPEEGSQTSDTQPAEEAPKTE